MEIQTIERELKWEKWESKFGTWAPKIKPFFDKGGFEDIYAKLKERSKQGKKITPIASDTFRAFRETPYERVKCIIMGMCPYHTFVDEGKGKGRVMVADGLN